jgi:hypothetical protein
MGLRMHATVQALPVRRPLRARPRKRVVIHGPARPAHERELAPVDSLAQARAARIIAERQLLLAIKKAELRYEETVELGREFDRRFERTKSVLRDAGYLSFD